VSGLIAAQIDLSRLWAPEFWQSLPPWLPLAIFGLAILLALVGLLGAARSAARARAESKAMAATVERLTRQVESFEQTVASQIEEATAPITRRAEEGEREIAGLKAQMGALEAGIAEAQKGTERALQKFERFEEYFRSVFEKELSFAFRSFDETLGSVLKEMKGELLRGVNRIDQIQGVVSSRGRAEDRLLSSEAEARRLLKSSAQPATGGTESPDTPAESPPKSEGASATSNA
jgi:chromosome segregation ATPase